MYMSVCSRGVFTDHRAMQVMGMVVMVVINRQALCVFAKQLDKSGVAADLFRVARAADVTVQACRLYTSHSHRD